MNEPILYHSSKMDKHFFLQKKKNNNKYKIIFSGHLDRIRYDQNDGKKIISRDRKMHMEDGREKRKKTSKEKKHNLFKDYLFILVRLIASYRKKNIK